MGKDLMNRRRIQMPGLCLLTEMPSMIYRMNGFGQPKLSRATAWLWPWSQNQSHQRRRWTRGQALPGRCQKASTATHCYTATRDRRPARNCCSGASIYSSPMLH